MRFSRCVEYRSDKIRFSDQILSQKKIVLKCFQLVLQKQYFLGKYSSGEMSTRRNVFLEECLFGKMSFGGMSFGKRLSGVLGVCE